ncbi:HYR domain-containing protein [Myxococcus stipitatus]|uniref:ELWxxDGT repeat protein n=1 Tax=Myxococcus stipitatus TaxID=83455 RepID=UPI001F30618B|nr:ELWxxDGT repeat protein [Myxococcus stipitatus]MCE9668425.1 HYR domain-containing protein [Myxococcus stipitatus]
MKDILLPEKTYDRGSIYSLGNFATLGDLTLFAASDDNLDIELWKTDGTPEGTSLVRDLRPGPTASQPRNLTAMGGHVYFTARTARVAPVEELWRTDGTPAGTTLVAHLPGSAAFMTARDGVLYLMTQATGGTSGFSLWKSNGTAVGTTVVKTVASSKTYPSSNFLWKDGTLFFSAFDDAHGEALWRSDGTPAGTSMAVDVLPVNDTSKALYDLVSAGDLIYFVTSGIEDTRQLLWRTDGTPEGTLRLLSLQGSPLHLGTTRFATAAGKLYFTQWDAQAGEELWTSDGTLAGTTRVIDLRPGKDDAGIGHLVGQGERVWFTATDLGTSQRPQVFVSDGTAEGTRQVTTSNPDTALSSEVLAAASDGAYFVGYRLTGYTLWKTDGTEAGTQQLINGLTCTRPHPMGEGRLILTGSSGVLCVSDGSPAGSRSLGKVTRTRSGGWPRQGVGVAGELLFSAKDDETLSGTTRLWISDGTDTGTLELEVPSSDTVRMTSLGVANGQTFIWRHDDGASESSSHRGAILGTRGGTYGNTGVLKSLSLPKLSHDARQLPSAVVMGDALYFGSPGSSSETSALWKSDGTPEGTVVVATLQEGIFSVDPRLFVNAAGRLYFAAGLGLGTESLWTSDGTEQGTRKVVTLSQSGAIGPRIRHMVALGSQVLFWADTAAEGHALWTSDGTQQGTRVVMRFSGTGFVPEGPHTTAVMNGQVYFVSKATGELASLWKTDGGPPVRVATFAPADLALVPMHLTVFQDALVFWAFDPDHGYEPWRSDGTPAGTVRLKDVNPGPHGSITEPGPFTSVGPEGPLLFAASDGVSGVELWRTDGTTNGTERVADLAPGPESSNPSDIVGAGRHVFFQAWTPETGTELWAMERPIQDTEPPQVTCPASIVVEDNTWYGQTVTYSHAVATDERAPAPVIRYDPPGNSFPEQRTTKVTATALDGEGNRATCTFDVTVQDTLPPTITCRTAPIRAEATHPQGTYVFVPFDSARADDIGSRPWVTYLPDSSTYFPQGTTPVTATATDNAGLQATCTFDVIVEDTRPPRFDSCPATVVQEASSPDGAKLDFVLPVATDVASTPEVGSEPAMGSQVPLGATAVTVTARDPAGNTATCNLSVEVRDTTPPELTCPPTQAVETTSAQGTTVRWPEATAKDLVSAVSLEYSTAPGSVFPPGMHSVSVTARDTHGNTRRCEFAVNVTLREKPDENPDPPTPPAPQPRGGGCQQAGGAGASGFGAALVGLMLWVSRRRRDTLRSRPRA